MKTLFALLTIFSLSAAQVRMYQVVMQRDSNITTYTAGDIVCGRDSLPSLISFAEGLNTGRIRSVSLETDTANAANATFRVFFYTDSLGLGRIKDNAVNAATTSKDSLMFAWANFTLATTGTASGSAAYDGISDANAPFQQTIRAGKRQGLWARIVATGAYVPKFLGKFILKVWIEP